MQNQPVSAEIPEPLDGSLVYWNGRQQKHVSELSSKERLVEAGWRELDDAELAKAFSTASAARVSKRAGVTTGSFFHHFPNAEAFAHALVGDLAGSLAMPEMGEVASAGSKSSTSPALDIANLVDKNMRAMWTDLFDDPGRIARFRCQMRLWTHHRVAYDDSRTVGDLIAAGYDRADDELERIWEPALKASGLEIAPPFNFKLIAVIATAMLEGLVIHASVDPDAIPPETHSNALLTFLGAVLKPVGAKVELQGDTYELHQPEPRSPQARSGAQRRFETRRKIVAACSDMFSDGWESVSATDLAARAGVSTQTITNLFGSVRAVAAATFAGQARSLYQNSLARSTEDPWKGLQDALGDLTVRARIEPEIARAVLAERVNSAVQRGGSLGEMDVRLEVPVSGALGLWLARLGMVGDRTLVLSTTLANFILTQAIVSSESTEDIVEMAMRLLPPEVTSKRRATA